jgi:hypothetical protein
MMNVVRIMNIYGIEKGIAPRFHSIIALSPENGLAIANKYNLSYGKRKVKSRRYVETISVQEAEIKHPGCTIWYEGDKGLAIYKKGKR